jgi:acetyl-CoA carboxylase biotin carboxylase subunit
VGLRVFSKVLIANRGEVALRVIRACRDLGVRTVAVHSEADRESLPVRLADEAVCVGPPPTARSYMNIPNIVSAALITGADAIHPGTGFLAERHMFAEICAGYDVTFIGPPAPVMQRLEDKARARKEMREIGLPVLPGSTEGARNLDEAQDLAQELGYPVMLKAVSGGGGRGIRLLRSNQDLVAWYAVAQAEAESSFGNPGMYLEKYVEDARHIEVQVLGDQHGHALHLGERDCSLHCSGATKRCSKRRRRRTCRPPWWRTSGRPPSPVRSTWAMPTRGPGNFWSTRRDSSTSWRSTRACR